MRLANWFAGAFILAGLLLIGVSIVTTGRTPLLVGPCFMAMGAGVFFMIRRGRLMAAVTTMMWGISALGLLIAFSFSGLRAPVMMLLPLIGMASGWLLGTKQGIAICAVNLLGISLLYRMHLNGYPFTDPVLHNYPLVLIFSSVLGTFLGILSISSFRKQYQRVVALSSVLQDRVNELRESEELLEKRVQERTNELQSTLSQLKDTQQELVKSETLASLGSMVAGVSHELNTPIGNAVTVASTLGHRFEAFEVQSQAGTMKRSELTEFTRQGQEMVALIERSVQRASELITSFKQVAMDQISERRREFNLRSVLVDVIATLQHSLKQHPWQVHVDIPADTVIDSFPGPLGQIITNLIQNAVIHAFEGRTEGSITVSATVDGDYVGIRVIDDGIGMDQRTLAHAFDPFFTTRLGRGGSGLGLSVCHRLSSSVLGGTLQVSSVIGQGASFTLRLPRTARPNLTAGHADLTAMIFQQQRAS